MSRDYDAITVVGIYVCSNNESNLFQFTGNSIDAGSILRALQGVSKIYTYNGRAFDLPFIHAHLGANLAEMFAHHDLMDDCHSINLYGGCKEAERLLGIERQLKEINGLDAVELWWKYVKQRDEGALSTLLAYNKEDVLMLKVMKETLEEHPSVGVQNNAPAKHEGLAIAVSQSASLARVINALGIRHVGEETANLLAGHFTDLDDLANADEARLTTVPSIGPKIARSITAFFRQEDNRRILAKLKAAGVWPRQARVETQGLSLAGKEFVITGTLKSFSREIAQERVKALGGAAKDNVTRNTAWLVVGADPGESKVSRARQLGTPQIDEEQFLAILDQKS